MAAKRTAALDRLYQSLDSARQINRNTLAEILAENADTLYGRRYSFSRIHSPQDYACALPLSDYSAYAGLVNVPNALTARPVSHMLATAGTTNRQKIFPLTEEALRRVSPAIHDLCFYISGVEGPTLHTSVFRGPQDGKMLLSSALYRHLRSLGVFERCSYVGGTELLFSDDIGDVAYVKAWLALSCPELAHIASIYLYDVLLLMRYIEENWRSLLCDMRCGRVSADLKPEIQEKLLLLRPSAERLAELERIFLDGFSTPVAPRLWKKLHLVSGIGGSAFELHYATLAGYIGSTPVHHFAYGASECIMGLALSLNRAEYALVPGSAYYEFLRTEDQTVVPMEEVEIGAEYQPVLTTFSGLYRYVMNDVVRVVAFAGEAPVVKICARASHDINIAGEHIVESVMRDALHLWSGRTGMVIGDCAVSADADSIPGFYHLFIESNTPADPAALAEAFDSVLRSLAADYDDVRKLSMVAPPQLHLLPLGQIAASKAAAGVTTAHSKPQLFLGSSQAACLLNTIKAETEHKP